MTQVRSLLGSLMQMNCISVKLHIAEMLKPTMVDKFFLKTLLWWNIFSIDPEVSK